MISNWVWDPYKPNDELVWDCIRNSLYDWDCIRNLLYDCFFSNFTARSCKNYIFV